MRGKPKTEAEEFAPSASPEAPVVVDDRLVRTGLEWCAATTKSAADIARARGRGLGLEELYSEGEFDWFFQA